MEVWNLASQPWKLQAQLTIVKDKCREHALVEDDEEQGEHEEEHCHLLDTLTFSPDGRFLAATDICDRVQAWCLVPFPAQPPGLPSNEETTQVGIPGQSTP